MTRLDQLFAFLALNPKESFVLFAIAKEYEKAENPEKALEYYLKLHDIDPKYVGLYYHLGKLYEKIQRLDDAISTYTKGMSVAKAANDRHALSELSGAKMNLVDEDED
jgi:tetratricopeptide (TPR) repeat protein